MAMLIFLHVVSFIEAILKVDKNVMEFGTVWPSLHSMICARIIILQ